MVIEMREVGDRSSGTRAVGGRAPGRSTPLPGGRAVVGGMLVALSVVGLFAAYQAANRAPTTRYVVVTSALSPGDRIAASDLSAVSIDLPASQAAGAFTDIGEVEGATLLSPLAAGELVQSSAVARPVGAPEHAQISLPVDPARALGGELRAGDVVDVIVSGSAAGAGRASASTIVEAATVVKVFTGSGGIGVASSVTVVLSVPPDRLEAVADAASSGDVTLARTTGVAR